MRKKWVYLLLFSLLTGTSWAENLSEIYQLALEQDTVLQAAFEKQQADSEVYSQAIANLLPVLSLSANTTAHHDTAGKYNTQSRKISLAQSVFRFENWQIFSQAQDQVKAAVTTYADAGQTLILRVADQYFNVLKAEDDVDLAKGKRKAFSRLLEQTQQRFKVGLIAITDVHEAQARHDNAQAEEIAAKNILEDEIEKLRIITGVRIPFLNRLQKDLALSSPEPTDVNSWVKTAHDQNLKLQAARYNLAATKKQIRREAGGHLPSLQIDGDITRSKGAPSGLSKIEQLTRTARQIGLTLTVPVFSGGSVLSRTRQARYNYQTAAKELETLYRQNQSDTRQAYRGVLTQISQVKALKQTVVSSQSALSATEAAFEVGTRTIVDVLNAQSELLEAQRNYAKARYNYILESFKLKQAAGILGAIDIEQVNSWLVTETTSSS